jgi:hypothetical protein
VVKPFAEKGFANIMTQKNYKRHEGRVRFYMDVQLHEVPDDPTLQPPGY